MMSVVDMMRWRWVTWIDDMTRMSCGLQWKWIELTSSSINLIIIIKYQVTTTAEEEFQQDDRESKKEKVVFMADVVVAGDMI